MNFTHFVEYPDLKIPPSVEEKIHSLNLRVKDIVYTFNQPMRQQQYPGEQKYKRERWFGSYWAGMLCTWSELDKKWVILTCWRKDVLTIS